MSQEESDECSIDPAPIREWLQGLSFEYNREAFWAAANSMLRGHSRTTLVSIADPERGVATIDPAPRGLSDAAAKLLRWPYLRRLPDETLERLAAMPRRERRAVMARLRSGR